MGILFQVLLVVQMFLREIKMETDTPVISPNVVAFVWKLIDYFLMGIFFRLGWDVLGRIY